jgi:hypothetical protein
VQEKTQPGVDSCHFYDPTSPVYSEGFEESRSSAWFHRLVRWRSPRRLPFAGERRFFLEEKQWSDCLNKRGSTDLSVQNLEPWTRQIVLRRVRGVEAK